MVFIVNIRVESGNVKFNFYFSKGSGTLIDKKGLG